MFKSNTPETANNIEARQNPNEVSNSHHHHHVACPCGSVVVSTISRHSLRSYALCRADHRPRFCCFRSFSIVRSRVCRGRPRGRQSFGGSSMLALRARLWSSSESERTMWRKNLSSPGHDRLGDRRLNGAGANYLVGDVGCEGNWQNMSKAPLIKRIKSLSRLHRHIPHFRAVQQNR